MALAPLLAATTAAIVALVAGSPPAPRLDERAPAAVSPGSDDFYRPPSPLPAGPPGTVLRSRPVTVHAAPGELLAAPVRAWQVLYLSTSAVGEPTAVSGTVLVPESPWLTGPRPLVTYAVGTHGLGDQCAPSYELRQGSEGEGGLMAQALARGWAVAVTDYERLGTPGTHTYAVGRAEGPAVLDAARAALHLPDAGLDPGAPVGIWGYSQGGQAAAWAGELQPGYAPELQVVGVAAGGVPADLERVARHLDGGPAAGLVLAGAVGFASAYRELPLDALLNPAGREAASQVAESCTGDIVARHAFRRLSDYTVVPDPIADPRFAARSRENRAGGQAPGVPVLLYHGGLDELIPLDVGQDLRADYCARGVGVQWLEIPLQGHVQAAVAGAPFAASWLDGRFRGAPVTTSC